MVNILTSSEAAAKFDAEITKAAIEQQPATQSRRKDRSSSTSGSGQQQPRRKEGEPDPVYSKSTSQLMKSQLSKANSRSGHSKAPSILGHVVKPGSISFYTQNGQTFAVTEGRWWLMKSPIKASWLNGHSNVSLNDIHIKAVSSTCIHNICTHIVIALYHNMLCCTDHCFICISFALYLTCCIYHIMIYHVHLFREEHIF